MALVGLKVVEFAGLAPGPFAGLILADNGASVIRVDRPGSTSGDVLCRGKRSICIDSKTTKGLAVLRRLIASSDVLIDPFRPGVMERLGLGPEVFLGAENGQGKGLNEKLIYARIIGFSRTGPHKDMAGHDINYLALSGVLSMLPGSASKPTFPVNLLADFAGGGLTCALGILLAVIQRGITGKGAVVDTDMVSGTRYLSSFPLLLSLPQVESPYFAEPRGQNLLDGGAPFYDVYTCKDNTGWMSVGCLEPQFFSVFIKRFVDALNTSSNGPDTLPGPFPPDSSAHSPSYALGDQWIPDALNQFDKSEWPKLRDFLERGFLSQTRDYWAAVFFGTDACAVPVLTPAEAAALDSSRSLVPRAHPRIGNTGSSSVSAHDFYLQPGKHTDEILAELGLTTDERRGLASDGAFGNNEVLKEKKESKL